MTHSDDAHEPSSATGARSVHAPMAAGKLQNYDSRRGAEAYKQDHAQKLHRRWSDLRERKLLQRYFAGIGQVDSLLDLPCGHGRLSSLLKDHCGQLIEADWSSTMIDLNRRDHGELDRRYLRASALEIPLRDRAVDVAVSFRLSHHLETEELRERHLRELFRVAGRHVVVTWFSATSLKNRLRNLQARFTAKRSKHVLHDGRVREIAAESGFTQRAARPLFVLGSGHVVGWFERSA